MTHAHSAARCVSIGGRVPIHHGGDYPGVRAANSAMDQAALESPRQRLVRSRPELASRLVDGVLTVLGDLSCSAISGCSATRRCGAGPDLAFGSSRAAAKGSPVGDTGGMFGGRRHGRMGSAGSRGSSIAQVGRWPRPARAGHVVFSVPRWSTPGWLPGDSGGAANHSTPSELGHRRSTRVRGGCRRKSSIAASPRRLGDQLKIVSPAGARRPFPNVNVISRPSPDGALVAPATRHLHADGVPRSGSLRLSAGATAPPTSEQEPCTTPRGERRFGPIPLPSSLTVRVTRPGEKARAARSAGPA